MHVCSTLQSREKAVVGQKKVFGEYFNLNSKLEILNKFPWMGSKLLTGSKKHDVTVRNEFSPRLLSLSLNRFPAIGAWPVYAIHTESELQKLRRKVCISGAHSSNKNARALIRSICMWCVHGCDKDRVGYRTWVWQGSCWFVLVTETPISKVRDVWMCVSYPAELVEQTPDSTKYITYFI